MASSSTLSSAVPAAWLSARARSANGLRAARGVRQPLHPLELRRPGGVDDRGGHDLVRRVQAEQLHAEAAERVGGEVRRARDAEGARARQGLDDRHVVDVSVALAQPLDLSDVPGDARLRRSDSLHGVAAPARGRRPAAARGSSSAQGAWSRASARAASPARRPPPRAAPRPDGAPARRRAARQSSSSSSSSCSSKVSISCRSFLPLWVRCADEVAEQHQRREGDDRAARAAAR